MDGINGTCYNESRAALCRRAPGLSRIPPEGIQTWKMKYAGEMMKKIRYDLRLVFLLALVWLAAGAFPASAQWEEEINWKYSNEDGTYKQNEWFTDSSGKTYYLDEDGYMVRGWMEDPDGNWYFFERNGILVTGPAQIDGRLYFFEADGTLYEGFRTVDGQKLRFTREGIQPPAGLAEAAPSYDGSGEHMQEQGEYQKDHPGNALPMVLFLAGAAAALYGSRKKGRMESVCLLAAVLLSSAPLFTRYLTYGHDLTFHLNRILGLSASMESGMFPVRLNGYSFNGYGYADAVFYPNLFLYIPALLYMAGVPFTAAVHGFLLLVHAASAASMYFSAGKLFCSRKTGCAAAVFYTLSVYRLSNAYTRAAYGELLAMVFLPLAVYGLYQLFFGDEKQWPVLTAAFTGIFQSHLITTVLVAAGCVLFGVCAIRRLGERKRLLALGKALLFTLLLNLWTLVPLVQYLMSGIDTSALQFPADTYSASWTTLLAVYPPGSGESPSILRDLSSAMPLGLGLALLCGVFLMLAERKRTGNGEPAGFWREARVLFWCGLAMLAAASPLFPWGAASRIPLLETASSYIQYPWRLLTFANCFLSMSGAWALNRLLAGKPAGYLYGTALVLAMVSSQFYLDQIGREKAEIWNEYNVTSSVGKSEYLYAGTQTGSLLGEAYGSGYSVSDVEKHGFSVTLRYEAAGEGEGYVEVPLLYYPGYRCEDGEGRQLAPERGTSNVVRVYPQTDAGTLHVYYQESGLWRCMEAVSLASLAALAAVRRFWGRAGRENKEKMRKSV